MVSVLAGFTHVMSKQQSQVLSNFRVWNSSLLVFFFFSTRYVKLSPAMLFWLVTSY